MVHHGFPLNKLKKTIKLLRADDKPSISRIQFQSDTVTSVRSSITVWKNGEYLMLGITITQAMCVTKGRLTIKFRGKLSVLVLPRGKHTSAGKAD
jgi:hypothetical protein